jgi:hypothetical protein
MVTHPGRVTFVGPFPPPRPPPSKPEHAVRYIEIANKKPFKIFFITEPSFVIPLARIFLFPCV